MDDLNTQLRIRSCARPGCGHTSDLHRLDDAQNVGPCDPEALFRCVYPGPDVPGPLVIRCDCPHFVDDHRAER